MIYFLSLHNDQCIQNVKKKSIWGHLFILEEKTHKIQAGPNLGSMILIKNWAALVNLCLTIDLPQNWTKTKTT